MEIFPAIDISGGQVVRLKQGDYQKMQIYTSDPVGTAQGFLTQGARNLHVVDLDGAREGQTVNFSHIQAICEAGGLFVEVGGGIRDEKSIGQYLSLGAGRAILGTAAVLNFTFIEEMVKKYGDQIAVSVDARDGRMAVQGWLTATDVDSLSFCRKLCDAGVKTVIYTDIARDGELRGTNLEAYKALRQIPELDVIASGGISFEQEIIALRDMGIYGAVIGKALYENKFSLPGIIALADGKE